MGPLRSLREFDSIFVRPTFSNLLLDIIKNRNENFDFPKDKSFGFRGFLNHDVRAMMLHAIHNSDFKKQIKINKSWAGPSKVGSDIQNEYIKIMNDNLISLCPRGSGIDSVRLIETCYYRRVPVLISDHDYNLVGEDGNDLDFVYRIVGANLTPDDIRHQLQLIYDTPIDILHDRSNLARKYFDLTIREYFKDPTLFYLNWLNSNES